MMIKFLRHIRQTMINKSNTKKYFLYAIGEIILVVIGILIALQVNNWNEDRKDRYREQNILKSIYDDISTDRKNMNAMIENERRNGKLNNELIQILKNPASKYDSSMDSLFGKINRYAVFYPQKIGYESLKSIGLDLLKNDDLKAAIVDLYDYQYGLIAETLDIKKQLYITGNSIFLKHLETMVDVQKLDPNMKRPNDFEVIKKDKIFLNYLTNIYYERLNFLAFAERAMETIKEVQLKIKNELN
jgi:hypothetical protein